MEVRSVDLSIDTKARKVMLDGKPLDTVTEISFLWNTNGVSSVTLTADVDIRMESEIFEEAYKDISEMRGMPEFIYVFPRTNRLLLNICWM